MIKLYSIVALVLLATLVQSLDSGKLFVVKQPSHHVYDFSSKNPLKLSDLNSVLLAANGFSVVKVCNYIKID